ncbi:helix-turn-helix domain-containing protein [Hymenobacter cellulosilyticus]|uniref:Helix-turn-helix domain-containing protein n=1 Tax=Hymenobacter cellulosilyticus TaxID=2932248 RepID=A0A8T9QHU9_9BACT|nr:helix-turn-helix domain-containing protein [Hymenobacter cellulosilyticus]UOQ75179.1 helix-turn-helix domain-containing protein [Hymenobacter cellulosilyticus]
MTIQTDAEYQAGMSRLEALDSNNPANLAEMEALGNALEAYEESHGHAPVHPDTLIYRIERYMFEHRLKKQELAQLLGITNSRLSEVLNGKRAVNIDLARRLHTKLHIPADFVLMHA